MAPHLQQKQKQQLAAAAAGNTRAPETVIGIIMNAFIIIVPDAAAAVVGSCLPLFVLRVCGTRLGCLAPPWLVYGSSMAEALLRPS